MAGADETYTQRQPGGLFLRSADHAATPAAVSCADGCPLLQVIDDADAILSENPAGVLHTPGVWASQREITVARRAWQLASTRCAGSVDGKCPQCDHIGQVLRQVFDAPSSAIASPDSEGSLLHRVGSNGKVNNRES